MEVKEEISLKNVLRYVSTLLIAASILGTGLVVCAWGFKCIWKFLNSLY